jgi:predicted nucleic acid-binding protein
MTPPMVTGEVQKLRGLFRLLEGKRGTAEAWEILVSKYQVSGKLAHDAHLVAIMQVYSVTDILTFNGSDFRRFPGITILDPSNF